MSSPSRRLRPVSPPIQRIRPITPPINLLHRVCPSARHPSTPPRPSTAEEPVHTTRRIPPKTIDFLTSAPEIGNPFPKDRQTELELYDANLPLHDANSASNSPASCTRYQSPVRGISSLNLGGESSRIVIRLPRRWKVIHYF